MTRRYVRMTREEYERKTSETELYFRGEEPVNECCPVCGTHDFFNFVDLSHKESGPEVNRKGKGAVVRTRVTGRELLDYLADKDNYPEHLNCAACNTVISIYSVNSILPDDDFVHYTKEQFQEALSAIFNGDIDKFIYSNRQDRQILFEYLENHFPEQSEAGD